MKLCNIYKKLAKQEKFPYNEKNILAMKEKAAAYENL